MALSGPILVVADADSVVRAALAAGGNLPSRHTDGAEAAAAVADAQPSAVILASATPDSDHQAAQEIADAVDGCGGAIIPMLAIAHGNVPVYPLALPVAADDVAT